MMAASTAGSAVAGGVHGDAANLPPEAGHWLTGDADIETEFAGALAALAKSNGSPIYIESGYRSTAEQQILWDKRKVEHPGEPDEETRRWVAYPGKSMHQLGLAADVKGYATTLGNDELLPFGLWKPLSNEPWHIEPLKTQKLRSTVADIG